MTTARTLSEIRDTFAAMPFAAQVGLTVETATPAGATASIILGPATAWSPDAFQAAYIGLVADVAAGAAALATVGRDDMPLTTAVTTTITGPTHGTELRATATAASCSSSTLTYTVEISTDIATGACATALVTLRVATSRTAANLTTESDVST